MSDSTQNPSVADLEGTIHDLETELKNSKAAHEDTKAELENTKTTLIHSEATHENTKTMLRDSEAAHEDTKAELKDTKTRLERYKATYKDTKTKLQNSNRALDSANYTLEVEGSNVKRLGDDNTRLSNELEGKNLQRIVLEGINNNLTRINAELMEAREGFVQRENVWMKQKDVLMNRDRDTRVDNERLVQQVSALEEEKKELQQQVIDREETINLLSA
jgi:chromosome segregation ATPase